MGHKYLCILLLLCGAAGCGSPAGKNRQETTATSSDSVKVSFRLPDIPAILESPEERIDYLSRHFWDNFNFEDSTFLQNPEMIEQAFVDFLDVLTHAPVEKGQKALIALMNSASVNNGMFLHFINLTEKYLYDPNSPVRNEEFYISVLNTIIDSSRLDDTFKVRPRYQLRMALKNRPGNVAADFRYTLSTGAVARMSSIKADYTILFFNNPDCHDCERVKNYIRDSKVFNLLTRIGSMPSLRILAVYPDADIALWKKHKAEYPPLMINSFDAGQVITNQELYDLKAIPTFYLLDKEKRVVLKDAPVERIEEWLEINLGN